MIINYAADAMPACILLAYFCIIMHGGERRESDFLILGRIEV